MSSDNLRADEFLDRVLSFQRALQHVGEKPAEFVFDDPKRAGEALAALARLQAAIADAAQQLAREIGDQQADEPERARRREEAAKKAEANTNDE